VDLRASTILRVATLALDAARAWPSRSGLRRRVEALEARVATLEARANQEETPPDCSGGASVERE